MFPSEEERTKQLEARRVGGRPKRGVGIQQSKRSERISGAMLVGQSGGGTSVADENTPFEHLVLAEHAAAAAEGALDRISAAREIAG